MEAQDTVMSDEQSEDLMNRNSAHPIKTQVRLVKEEQAEISFKVGKTLGVAESLNPALKAIEDSRKAGIREVLEWVEPFMQDLTGTFGNPEGNDFILISRKEWQVQQKKWGIRRSK